MGRKILLSVLSAPCRFRLDCLAFTAAHPSSTHFTGLCGTFLRYQGAPPASMARGRGGCTTATGQAAKESKMPVPGLATRAPPSTIAVHVRVITRTLLQHSGGLVNQMPQNGYASIPPKCPRLVPHVGFSLCASAAVLGWLRRLLPPAPPP